MLKVKIWNCSTCRKFLEIIFPAVLLQTEKRWIPTFSDEWKPFSSKVQFVPFSSSISAMKLQSPNDPLGKEETQKNGVLKERKQTTFGKQRTSEMTFLLGFLVRIGLSNQKIVWSITFSFLDGFNVFINTNICKQISYSTILVLQMQNQEVWFWQLMRS